MRIASYQDCFPSFVAKGFQSGTKNGISCHYNFYYDYHMKVGTLMCRRVPCSCPACHGRLQQPWVDGIPPLQQPKFQSSSECVNHDVLSGWNSWRHITLVPHDKTYDESQVNEVFEDCLGYFEERMAQTIQVGNVCAYSAGDDETTDGYYVFSVTSLPFSLGQDSEDVEGCGFLPKGTIVVRGVYWNKVPSATRWYTPVPLNATVERLFRVRYVLNARIGMLPATDYNRLSRSDRDRIIAMGARRVAPTSHKKVVFEIGRRELLDFCEEYVEAEEVHDGDKEEEDDNEFNAESI